MIKTKKQEPVQHLAFDRKYRPASFEQVIGHDDATTRMRGMVKTGRVPNAIAFFGPPSAGKTTLARVLATEVNGAPADQQSDYKELNAGTQKSIEDIRELEKLARFRPMKKRRFIVIDEAQQILTNASAAQGLLKPLEEPALSTTIILCSMEPARFQQSTVGRAILSRCTKIYLEPHTNSELLKFALRIVKGEKMSYVMDEERKLLKSVVVAAGGEARQVAHLLEELDLYYAGLEKKPKLLPADVVKSVLQSAESADEKLIIDFMVALYSNDFAAAFTALLDVKDDFMLMKKVGWISEFMVMSKVVKGKHPKIVWMPTNRTVLNNTRDLNLKLSRLMEIRSAVNRVQAQAATFIQPAATLLGDMAFQLIQGR